MARAMNAEALVHELDTEFAKKPLADWGKAFDREDVWWAPVQTIAEALEDPAVRANGVVVKVPGGEGDAVEMVATPVDFYGTPWSPQGPVPELGQHTEEVLLELGYEWEQTERDYQEVEELWENTLSAIWTGRPASALQTRIHYEHTWRDGSSYDGSRPFIASHTPAFIDEEIAACADDGFTPEECLWENHPLLRKYHLANLHRDSIQSLVTWIPHEIVSISASVGWTLDDYYDTTYGLTGYQSVSPGIDVSVAPLEWLSVYGFYNYDWSRYKQKGISFGDPTQAMDPARDWWSRQSVYTHTAGVGFDVAAIPNRLEFGVDYVYADSTGVIGMDVGSALAAVPNLPNNLRT